MIKPAAFFSSVLPYAEVPFIRNSSFLERSEQLEKLKSRLLPDEPSRRPCGLVTASLSGAGGQGKTQIATEFVHRFIHCYDAVLWCTADSSLTLAESLATHADGLGLVASKSTSTDEQNRAVLKRWLIQSTRRGRMIDIALVIQLLSDQEFAFQKIQFIGSWFSTTWNPLRRSRNSGQQERQDLFS